jgi:hypothetical protein
MDRAYLRPDSRVVEGTVRPSEPGPAKMSVELARYRDAWRQTLETVKEALAALEAAVVKDGVEPTPAISGLVERLVAVATAAGEAAGQQIRAEARAQVARVQAELLRERDELKAVSHDLDAERLARARAEAALEEAERARRQSVSVYESQLEALRAEVEANRAELSRLQEQIDAAQAERAGLVAALKHAVTRDVVRADTPRPTFAKSIPVRESASTEANMASAAAPVAGSGEDEARHLADPDPTLVAYARELLGKAEAMYWTDVSARRSTSELIDRLTSNLRRARLMFARRIGVTDLKETVVFEQQLAEALNTTENPSFSRHLGIAAYESLPKPGL